MTQTEIKALLEKQQNNNFMRTFDNISDFFILYIMQAGCNFL